MNRWQTYFGLSDTEQRRAREVSLIRNVLPELSHVPPEAILLAWDDFGRAENVMLPVTDVHGGIIVQFKAWLDGQVTEHGHNAVA